MTQYQPGVCNIGRAEQRKRYGLGLVGSALTVLITALIFLQFLPGAAIFGVFIASFMACEGLFQGYLNFCAGFATKGIYDISSSGGEKEDVEDEEARKKDKIKALQIHLYSLTGALTATAFVYLGLTI